MDPNDELTMHPGPKIPSVLHLQSSHRSSTVWDVCGGDAHRSRRRNPTQARFPPLHESMIPILEDLRFDGVSRLSCVNIDWSLITALVERWRPETHTFHLPFGESTITLQDVAVLLGLRIDGDVITGTTGGFEGGWSNLVEKIFGKKPKEDKELKGGRLLLSWLTSTVKELPAAPSDQDIQRYTQSYILQLIAGILFTDKSGGLVHCMYIPLIQDFGRCRNLGWGAAVLAYLFRELCKSCRSGVEEMAGCVLLLQLWAWTRLPFLAPVPRGPVSETLDNPLWSGRAGPYGMRWCLHLKFTDTSSHVLSTLRLSFDALSPSHFEWQPYTEDVLANLSEHCTEGSEIWCYKGPLICFHIVEPHLPDRCMRQFGKVQEIPVNEEYSKALHEINLQGKQSTNWISMHEQHITHWNHRQEHLIGVIAHSGVGVVDGYYEWYTNITRRFHTRIAGSHFYTLDMFDHISSIARGEIDGSIEDIAHLCAHARQLVKNAFNYGVFQDYPVKDRREKEILKRPKPKKAGHKGGRGGVNAPKQQGIQIDDIPRGDNVGADIIDKDVENLQGGETVPGGVHLEHPEVLTEVNPTPPFGLPNWNLLPSGDFLRMSNDAVLYHSPDRSIPHDPAPNDHSPISHPTFNLMSQSPPRPQLVQQKQVSPPAALSMVTPTPTFTAGSNYQVHTSVQRHSVQPPPSVVQQPPFVVQQPPPPSVQPPTTQHHPSLVQQQPAASHHNMQLRERRSRHMNCGTRGKKVPDCKRLRYKY